MKILLIEDEPPAARRLQKILDRLLENLGEWGKVPAEITWIGDPDLALAEAAKGPDLIFLDLNLGSFHSLDWLRESRLPADKVIIVSADTRYCDEAFALGVFAYAFKPIDEDILRKHLERYVKSRNLIA
ncbi:MAG: Two component transcriptional regulator, LytTR family [Fibrobacteres bacterium]|nr:Two component transcriptional regulator, LytTR family [Fibrobacterota bacterium]